MLNKAISKAGWPFSLSILASIEKYSRFSTETQSKRSMILFIIIYLFIRL